jgi:hypothetical protein
MNINQQMQKDQEVLIIKKWDWTTQERSILGLQYTVRQLRNLSSRQGQEEFQWNQPNKYQILLNKKNQGWRSS